MDYLFPISIDKKHTIPLMRFMTVICGFCNYVQLIALTWLLSLVRDFV